MEYTLIALQSEVENISNMVGWYDADNYDSTTKIWKDKSEADNDSYYTSGYPSIIYYNLNKNPVISGTTSDSIRLPLGNYYYGGTGYQDFTFFFVARYSGTTRRRIFNDLENDWHTGFDNADKVGISYHGAGGWVGNLSATQTTLLENGKLDDWWIGTTQRQKVRVNGTYVAIDINDHLLQSPNKLAINIGQTNENEWNIAELLYF